MHMGIFRAIRPLLVALLCVAVGALVRRWLLHDLGTRIVWVTFYPAVTVAGLYGGFAAGIAASLASCALAAWGWSWIGPAPFIKDSGDWLGLSAFVFNCLLIAGVAEWSRRSRLRAIAAQAEAERADRAKSAFLAGMSHELRTPLNAILGFSDLLQVDPGMPPDSRRALDIIHRSGEHLLRLIDDVLDMAKIESGRAEMRSAPVDLKVCARSVCDLVQARAAEKALFLGFEVSPEAPALVLCDELRLRQILLNLLGNAIKFTEKGGVTLRLERGVAADGAAAFRFVVEDTGRGIDAADLDRIFQPFIRVGDTAQEGTGLGLAIARKFADLMGGSLTVRSAPGQGSSFALQLPATETAGQTPAAPEPERRVLGLAPGQPEVRVLVVEDQEENWLLMERLLSQAGFAVRHAGNGAEGLERFADWKPQFIWMDCRMPVMDGFEATRRIRELPGGREVRIAAMTASVYREERDRVLAAGMDDFVRKPARPGEIFSCMERHLGVRLLTADAEAGSVAVDPADPARIRALPSRIRQALKSALLSLDPARIREAIGEAGKADPEAGRTLAGHAERLEYSALHRLIEDA